MERALRLRPRATSRSTLVLGAGACTEVPLAALCRASDEVVLADLDIAAMQRGCEVLTFPAQRRQVQLVQADLTARPRPAPAKARPGVCWCHISRDRLAARQSGVSTARWLAWVARCEAKAITSDDPMPFLRPKLDRLFTRMPGGMRSARLAKP